ncbi:type II secretion system F family protein [Sphingomonas solaris]|uniref:Type II secretion system F family protein n=2 Tax=Alterirhizorhabdus solaris TaxID=2529389 RepID=A0A558QT16_9SPHN|nr:type II secretion system F family protein [Sphingomonas solaris]
MPFLLLTAAIFGMLAMGVLAFTGPSTNKAQSRRLDALKGRHVEDAVVAMQMRRITAHQQTSFDLAITRMLPNPTVLRKRIEMTGKEWTLGQYMLVNLGLALFVAILAAFKGAPLMLALLGGIFIGVGLPHMVIGHLIKKRVASFTSKFPDAIELLVRGLRSGLPISETMGVVASEVPGPVGVEFRTVVDKMKIGRTMEAALQETADRLGTPEFQFFVITLAIQRETGGNLAETLSNLADVLRKRAQMKLKIKAMSSESKASAYIIGVLPFMVFGSILWINPDYMMGFFRDERLMMTGLGGLVWMGIGAFVMRQMINFEI